MSEESDMHVKRQLIEATDAVRKKFNSIKRGRVEDQSVLQKFYEPISNPLQTLVQAVKKRKTTSPQKIQTSEMSPTGQLFDSTFINNTPPTSPYMESNVPISLDQVIEMHLDNIKMTHPDYDNLYGVRYDEDSDTFHMGSRRAEFGDGNMTLFFNNKKIGSFKLTPELCNTIFLKNPPILLRLSDIQTFKKLLTLSNAAYKDYDVRGGLNVTDSKKSGIVTNIMSPPRLRSKQGGGINVKNKLLNRKRNVEYVYWNNVKELIDRLKLLWGSRMAGHTGHDNEILSIIEELREEGVIY